MASSQHDGGIRVRQMPQLFEAVDRDDDWTGVTSATERRKRQNRLNSRAFRRRKAQEEQEQEQSKRDPARSTTSHSSAHEHEVSIPCWSEADQAVIPIPISSLPSHLRHPRAPLLLYTTTPTALDKVIFPVSSDHLFTLLQYNVLRACLVNRDFIAKLDPQGGGGASTALTILPEVNSTVLSQILPQSLHPTLLQMTIPHAAWIDILPHPTLRDNLILITTSPPPPPLSSSSDAETNIFDEDALWTDTVGGLFEGLSSAQADHVGGIVWASPWDVSGWEVSVGFWRKYGWVFRGCEREVLAATNRWRRQRGEEDLVVDMQ